MNKILHWPPVLLSSLQRDLIGPHWLSISDQTHAIYQVTHHDNEYCLQTTLHINRCIEFVVPNTNLYLHYWWHYWRMTSIFQCQWDSLWRDKNNLNYLIALMWAVIVSVIIPRSPYDKLFMWIAIHRINDTVDYDMVEWDISLCFLSNSKNIYNIFV